MNDAPAQKKNILLLVKWLNRLIDNVNSTVDFSMAIDEIFIANGFLRKYFQTTNILIFSQAFF